MRFHRLANSVVARSDADADSVTHRRDTCKCCSIWTKLFGREKFINFFWEKSAKQKCIPQMLTSRSSDRAAGRFRNKWSQNIESIVSAIKCGHYNFSFIICPNMNIKYHNPIHRNRHSSLVCRHSCDVAQRNRWFHCICTHKYI